MYIAKGIVSVYHEPKTPVTSDYYEDVTDELTKQLDLVKPKLDFTAAWSLGGLRELTTYYVNIVVDLYLYDGTLWLDPEEIIKKAVKDTAEITGKTLVLYKDEIETDVPDEETRKCPSCEAKGWVYVANERNNKVTIDCQSCKKTKRVPVELALKLKKVEPKYICRGICSTKSIYDQEPPKEVPVEENQLYCNDCKTKLEPYTNKNMKENQKWTTPKEIPTSLETEKMREIKAHIQNLNSQPKQLKK